MPWSEITYNTIKEKKVGNLKEYVGDLIKEVYNNRLIIKALVDKLTKSTVDFTYLMPEISISAADFIRNIDKKNIHTIFNKELSRNINISSNDIIESINKAPAAAPSRATQLFVDSGDSPEAGLEAMRAQLDAQISAAARARRRCYPLIKMEERRRLLEVKNVIKLEKDIKKRYKKVIF